MSRRGLALLETLAALALFAVLGLPVLAALSTGATGTARGGEYQLAALLVARVADAVELCGPAGLDALGPGGDVDLAGLDAGAPLSVGSGTALVLDGVRFTAKLALDRPLPGLSRARIKLAWERAGAPGRGAPGRIDAVKMVGSGELGWLR